MNRHIQSDRNSCTRHRLRPWNSGGGAAHTYCRRAECDGGRFWKGGAGGRGGSPAKIKPYAKVIPASAITHRGLLITHQVNEKLYFELPPSAINIDLLMVGRLVRGGRGRPGTIQRLWRR